MRLTKKQYDLITEAWKWTQMSPYSVSRRVEKREKYPDCWEIKYFLEDHLNQSIPLPLGLIRKRLDIWDDERQLRSLVRKGMISWEGKRSREEPHSITLLGPAHEYIEGRQELYEWYLNAIHEPKFPYNILAAFEPDWKFDPFGIDKAVLRSKSAS